MYNNSDNFDANEFNEFYTTSSSMGARRRESQNEIRQEPWIPRESEMEQEPNLQRRLFPSTPTISRTQNTNRNQVNSLTTRKENSESEISGARTLDQLQKAIFTPLKDQRSSHSSNSNLNYEEISVRPKILNLTNDEATKMEVLRSKRSIIAAGPPILKDKPTLEEFYDWKLSIIQFLEFLPGYEHGILEIQPNLENLSDENLAFTIQKYELIYQILTKATINNKLVRLKTGAISRVPVRNLVTWWNTVTDIFQASDTKIKTLKDEYTACMQQENQTSTEYLQEIEEKASELRKLGCSYSSSEVGLKVHEGLLPSPKLFVFTNLLCLRIPCSLQSITKVLKTYDDTMSVNAKKSTISRNLLANVAEFEENIFKDHGNDHTKSKTIYENRYKNNSNNLKKNPSHNFRDSHAKNSEIDDDEEIIRNLDIEAAVHNLRKFRRIVKQINAIKDKDDRPSNQDHRQSGRRIVVEETFDKDHRSNGTTNQNNTRPSRTRSRSPSRERHQSRQRSPSMTRTPTRPLSEQGKNQSTFNRSTYMANTPTNSRPNNSNSAQRQGNPSKNENHERSRSHSNRNNTFRRTVINNSRNSYYLILPNLHDKGKIMYLGTSFNNNVLESFWCLIKMIQWLKTTNDKVNTEALLDINNGKTNYALNYERENFGNHKTQEVLCYMVTIDEERNQHQERSTSSTELSKATRVSSNTPSLITTGSAGMIQPIGITKKIKFVPAEKMKFLKSMSKEETCQHIATGGTTEVTDDDIPRSDTGESLHPIFSPLLQASHRNSQNIRAYKLKDFEHDQIGFSPVQVISHSMRWRTVPEDCVEEDSDTYQTDFGLLSKLCTTKTVTPLDVLGLAITAANEIVKHERTFNEGRRPNPFDYEECQTEGRYTEIKSTLTSAGFAYTELVPHTSTPNPDDDTDIISLAERYGGTKTSPNKTDLSTKKVCLKTTRFILKKHTHISPSVDVDAELPEPLATVNAGKYYNDECKKSLEETIQEWMNDAPKDIGNQTEEILTSMCDASTQYSTNDIDASVRETPKPAEEQYEELNQSILKALLSFHAKHGSSKKNDKRGQEIAESMINLTELLFKDQSTDTNRTSNTSTNMSSNNTESTDTLAHTEDVETAKQVENRQEAVIESVEMDLVKASSRLLVTTNVPKPVSLLPCEDQSIETNRQTITEVNAVPSNSVRVANPTNAELNEENQLRKRKHDKVIESADRNSEEITSTQENDYNFSKENEPSESPMITEAEAASILAKRMQTIAELPDPKGLLGKLVTAEWYDQTYVDKDIEGYPWYFLPPYIYILLNHSDQIDLFKIEKPASGLLSHAYRNITLDNEGRYQFVSKVIRLLEKHQERYMVKKAKEHPLIANHEDPRKLIDLILNEPWHKHHRWITHRSGYEWYLSTPFWIILTNHSEAIDLTMIKQPLDKKLLEILAYAYGRTDKGKLTELPQYINDIIEKLREHEQEHADKTLLKPKLQSIIVIPDKDTSGLLQTGQKSPGALQKASSGGSVNYSSTNTDRDQSNDYRLIPVETSPEVSTKRKRSRSIEDKTLGKEETTSNLQTSTDIEITETTSNQDKAVDDEEGRDTMTNPKPHWRRSVRKKQVLMMQVEQIRPENEYGIEETPQLEETILDSGCSQHLTSKRHMLRDFIENGDNDPLNLGYVRMADGRYTPILGYGTYGRWKNVLYVPDLDAALVLSVGLLAQSNYSINFDNQKVAVINQDGDTLIRGHKNQYNLYVVDDYAKDKNRWSGLMQPPLPEFSNNNIAICLMIKSSSKKSSSSKEVQETLSREESLNEIKNQSLINKLDHESFSDGYSSETPTPIKTPRARKINATPELSLSKTVSENSQQVNISEIQLSMKDSKHSRLMNTPEEAKSKNDSESSTVMSHSEIQKPMISPEKSYPIDHSKLQSPNVRGTTNWDEEEFITPILKDENQDTKDDDEVSNYIGRLNIDSTPNERVKVSENLIKDTQKSYTPVSLTKDTLRWRKQPQQYSPLELILDSGCTHHMVTNLDLLTDVVLNDKKDTLNLGQVHLGYGAKPNILGYGTLWPLGKVLYVPGIRQNLISVRMLTMHGFSISFINDTAKVEEWTTLSTIMTASVSNGDLYRCEWVPNLTDILQANEMFNQPLPSTKKPAKCHMTRILNDISNTTRILNDPIANTNELIIDSGCSDHMFNTNVQMTDYHVLNELNRFVQVANGQNIPVLGVGVCGILKRVFYVPDLSHSLLSVRELTREGCLITFDQDRVVITHGTSNMRFQPITAYVINNLYRVPQSEFELRALIPHQSCLVHRVQELGLNQSCNKHLGTTDNYLQCNLVSDARTDPISTWHYAFGHPSAERTRHLCSCYNLPGVRKLEAKRFEFLKNCRMCRQAKGIRNSFNGTVSRPLVKGKQWYADIKGPFTMPSLINENKYVFGIIEGKSRMLIQYYLKEKSEVHKYLKRWYEDYIVPLRLTQNNQENLQHIFLNTDMGECTSNSTINYLKGVGVELTTTCPYTPEQNMVIERVWRTIGESAIAMLLTASLSEPYWEEARSTACYIYNRSPGAHIDLHPKSPFEQYYDMSPHVLHFKIFGTKCYPTVLNKPKGNHNPKALLGIFVGYQDQQPKGWKIYLPGSNEFIITAHVHFENEKYNKESNEDEQNKYKKQLIRRQSKQKKENMIPLTFLREIITKSDKTVKDHPEKLIRLVRDHPESQIRLVKDHPETLIRLGRDHHPRVRQD